MYYQKMGALSVPAGALGLAKEDSSAGACVTRYFQVASAPECPTKTVRIKLPIAKIGTKILIIRFTAFGTLVRTRSDFSIANQIENTIANIRTRRARRSPKVEWGFGRPTLFDSASPDWVAIKALIGESKAAIKTK